MTYSIVYTNLAGAQLKKLDKPSSARLVAALERIRIRPEVYLKRLVGVPYYSLRSGDYRAILELKKSELIVLVIKVGHRRSIYKKI